jgi:ABC-2 type transport system permease protein
MRVFLSLTALYLKSFYNLPGKRVPGAKATPKAFFKALGIGLLALLVVGQMGALFVATNMAMYEALAPAGLQGLVLLNMAVLATVLTLAVGFLTALSTYFLNEMELQFLAMPIEPRALLGAKFAAVYVSEAVVSLFFIASAMVIFGIKEAPHPLMYLWGILAGALLPMPALALSYLIQIPLMGMVRFLKNKQTILFIGGIMGLAIALGFNLYFQATLARIGDPSWIAEHMAGPDSLLAKLGGAYPPALLTWRALSDPATPRALGSMALMLILCAAGPALVVVFLSGAYARSLVGFNESRIKKLGRAGADAFIRAKLRRGPAFLSLVRREINLMNREPMYLLNGPFLIILGPIIIGIMMVAQKDAFLNDPDMAGMLALLRRGGGAILAGLAGAFLGSGTSISCTSLSRDAKALPFLKSLPLSAGRFMLAKLAHGLIFALFGSLMGAGLSGYALGLGASDLAAALIVAIGLSFLLNLGGLWLDTANPRLSWDNPMAALKQNPNSIIAILAAMGIAGAGGFAAFALDLSTWVFAFWFGILPLLAFCLLLLPYPRYAARRIAELDA